jgi:hypothetical protein
MSGRRRPEQQIQKALADHLRTRGRHLARIGVHPANGGGSSCERRSYE